MQAHYCSCSVPSRLECAGRDRPSEVVNNVSHILYNHRSRLKTRCPAFVIHRGPHTCLMSMTDDCNYSDNYRDGRLRNVYSAMYAECWLTAPPRVPRKSELFSDRTNSRRNVTHSPACFAASGNHHFSGL